MAKSDRSIHNICIAAIKRHTIPPFDFSNTCLFESPTSLPEYLRTALRLETAELPICSTFKDEQHWSLLTTRRLITHKDVYLLDVSVAEIQTKTSGFFEALSKKTIEERKVETMNGISFPYFLETGRASMVMISGLQTILNLSHKSAKDRYTDSTYLQKGFLDLKKFGLRIAAVNVPQRG